jgi:hypothetical protein
MIDLYDTYPDRRDEFAIVIVHTQHPEVDDLTDLEPILYGPGGISERYWNGRRLPFPLVFDGTGASFDPYGTLGYFEMVIDPGGHLVRDGDTGLLARILAGEPPPDPSP